MSKSVYVRVFHDLELLRYVLRRATERQPELPTGMNTVYCYCAVTCRVLVVVTEMTRNGKVV